MIDMSDLLLAGTGVPDTDAPADLVSKRLLQLSFGIAKKFFQNSL